MDFAIKIKTCLPSLENTKTCLNYQRGGKYKKKSMNHVKLFVTHLQHEPVLHKTKKKR